MSIQPRSVRPRRSHPDDVPPTTCSAKATTAHVVGDFNGWSMTATPMRVDLQGFVAEVPLVPGRPYRFRTSSTAPDGRTTGRPTSTCNEYGGTDSVLDLTDARLSFGGGRVAAGDDDTAQDEPPILHLECVVDGDATVVFRPASSTCPPRRSRRALDGTGARPDRSSDMAGSTSSIPVASRSFAASTTRPERLLRADDRQPVRARPPRPRPHGALGTAAPCGWRSERLLAELVSAVGSSSIVVAQR